MSGIGDVVSAASMASRAHPASVSQSSAGKAATNCLSLYFPKLLFVFFGVRGLLHFSPLNITLLF